MKLFEMTIELCCLKPDQAYKLLKRLSDEKIIEKQGVKRHSFYVKPPSIRHGA